MRSVDQRVTYLNGGLLVMTNVPPWCWSRQWGRCVGVGSENKWKLAVLSLGFSVNLELL